MDLNKFNKSIKETYLPRKRLTEMAKDVELAVTDLKQVNTKYGEKVILTINNEYQVFLPPKGTKIILDNANFRAELEDKAQRNLL